MSACRIVNQAMVDAHTDVTNIAAEYDKAGEDLITALKAAIADMEGEAKDEFLAFIDGDIKTFFTTDLNNALLGLADMIETNRSTFADVDNKIAQAFREGQ